ADHATVLPGFFDLHAHYALDLFGEGRLGRVDEAKVNAAVFLANGVTSTFPAGEVTPTAFDEAVAAIASGERPGPRIHRSGAYFGSWRAGWDHGAMTSDSIRAEVRYWAGRGVRGFKAKGIRPAQLEVLIDEAHRFGLTVTGHLDSGFRDSVNPRDAIAMGIDRVEHFLGGDATPADRSAYASIERFDLDDPETRRLIDEQVGRFVDGGVFFDATLHTYGYYAERDPEVFPYFRDEMGILTPYARSVVEARLPMDPNEQFGRIYRVKHGTVRAFVEGGGAHLLTVGTDHPSWGEYFSGFALHRELHALSRADVPNHVVLRAATANAARALGLGHRLGTIEPGKLADLVVVDGDPLADITVTRKLLHVIRDGRVYDPAALLDSVRGTLGPVGPEEAAAWGAGIP
ncbi:MAG: amidohydrolase family protein, partial [Gemmatimonadota bacterium]|nr:amidohydrolase family protein [Gemmatimonadota bacterium]